jgi:adenylate cyclase
MAVLAPAIIDVRPADGTPGIARWLRGIGVRQVRLACGLVMFSYIFSHFLNHALGNFSYDTMGLWALYQRRHFRYTVIEISQLLLGLSIQLLIASHLGIMRLGGLLYGRDPPFYSGVLFAY